MRAIIDNTYRGPRLALWLLGLVTAVKVVQQLSVMIDGYGIVAGADGVPLDTFSPEAARTVVAAWTGMSVSRLLICVWCGLVVWRYRSAMVVTFLLLAAHDIAREFVLQPIRTGQPVGPYVNWALIVLTLAGVAMAARSRHTEASRH